MEVTSKKIYEEPSDSRRAILDYSQGSSPEARRPVEKDAGSL